MNLTYANKIAEIVESLSRAISAAADPHVDGRDEMHQHLENAEEAAKELVAYANESRADTF